LLLSPNGSVYVVEAFVVDETVAMILAGEAFNVAALNVVVRGGKYC
jgi:hypothetical protein